MRADQYNRIDSIKVKARADYKCQRCGSDEAVQAHAPDGDHTDWREGIALCGNCHADEHPDMPRSLFLSKVHQPYWHNISARALAIECNHHTRTIIRHAKRLRIASNCDLSDKDKQRIKFSFNKTQVYKELKINRCKKCRSRRVTKAGFKITKGARLQRYQCKACGHIFVVKDRG